MVDKELIRLELKDRVASIVLDSPPENRMTRHFFRRLHEVLTWIESLDIGALMILSSGRHFSAGADVEDIKMRIIEPYIEGTDFEEVLKQTIQRDCALLSKIESLPYPVIGVMNGLCIGSGLELALACDIRICSTDCIVGSPEFSWGLFPGCNGTVRLERLLGRSKALEFIMMGDMINSQRALSMGLVNRVVDRRNLTFEAMKLAQFLAEKSREDTNIQTKKSVLKVCR